ncbi:hypothetical protein PBI_SPORTO_48 [Arthrobacter phage Sporto]|nr:hypothetical protein PBI_SPORTO_48 [Arthrobacter phage Sporto]
MKNAVIFLSGVVVGSVAVPIAIIAACVIVETRNPSNPIVQSEIVPEEGK